MLHLARVEKGTTPSGGVTLRLLARQYSGYSWVVIKEPESLLAENIDDYGEGRLVLVSLTETKQIETVKDAVPWLLEIIQVFLKKGITPEFLQEEANRAEQWRQNLTLQSQDLDRRALELEARREQIEQLEESLQREKKQMEVMASQYKDQNQELDRRAAELEAQQHQLQRLEENLKREKMQLEELLAQQKMQVKPSN